MMIDVVVILSNVTHGDFHNDRDYGNENNDDESEIVSVNGNDDELANNVLFNSHVRS